MLNVIKIYEENLPLVSIAQTTKILPILKSYKTLIFLMFCHVDLYSHSNISFNNTIFVLFALGSFFKLLPPTLSAISVNNTGSNLILASSLKTKENGRNHSG